MNSTFKLIFKIFSVALTYYVAGVLGIQLSLPPGFATSFWPPAGISLACLLICGINVWPGILIGAFFVNVIPQFNDNLAVSWGAIFLPAFIPAIGSTLQAIAGSKLIRRYVGYPCSLNEERIIGKFLLLGGPVACTISATIAVTTFCAFGLQPWASFAFTWGTWWVGDCIGVMIVAPLLILMMSEEKDSLSRKNFSILLPSLFVLALCIFTYVKVSQWEQEKIENELKAKANYISSEIEERLGVYLEVIRSIEGLFASSNYVEETEFRNFVQGPLSRYHGLQALSWDLRLKESDRAEFTKILKQRDIELKELTPEGQVVPARKMNEYVVPWFIEPEATNRTALGFNLYSNESRKKAIQLAISSGEATVSNRLQLIQDPKHAFGLLIFVPVYEKNKSLDTTENREKYAMGVVVGVLKLEAFIKTTFAEYNFSGINFEIEDLSAPENERTIYASPNFHSKMVSSRDLNWSNEVNFAGRTWKINFKKSYAALLENRPWQAWFILATGLLFTGFFIAFLMVIIGRTARIEALVDKRTEELAEVKSNMISASKMSALGEMAGGMAHEINTPLTIINLKVAQIQNELEAKEISFVRVNEGLKKIEDTVARIAKIIRGLRYFARDTKSDPYERAQVSAILDDTLYLCVERFRHNGIILKVGPYPQDLHVDCRPTEISQVILNLLNNACDAIMDLPEKWIEIKLVEKNQNLEIRITDSGSGIPANVQEKIMQPFFSTKPVGKGTGIGLSISKGIVESHKGTLTIDNSVKNTCFVITLPIHQDKT